MTSMRREFLRRCAFFALPAVLLGHPAWGMAAATSTAVAPTRARGRSRINVRDKGARGDGQHDDTAAFQAAIDALPDAGGTVQVPAGTYLIDALKYVNLRSRMHLQLSPDAKLVAIPNDFKRSYVLYAFKVSDVEISGGQIVGERAKHQGTEGEWGHGIQLRGASKVTVRNIRISDCWGDGICIGGADERQATPSDDIFIANVVCTGNRRQGLSIGRSRNVRVYDSEFSNTAGTNPQFGIDIEPDRPGGTSGIHIENCVVRNNRGGGIQIYRRVDDVTIKRCTIEGNRGPGILAVTARDGMITGNRITGNGLSGVALRQETSDFEVNGNRFRNNGLRRRDTAKAPSGTQSEGDWAIHISDDSASIKLKSNIHEAR
ncbi:MAG TPA: right-handed parallel beta-helix repeat-containing protein [Lysobacter sp.]|nr:right-handed parallel beta-helix repeat-containing protein [Lysobacter sp.]